MNPHRLGRSRNPVLPFTLGTAAAMPDQTNPVIYGDA